MTLFNEHRMNGISIDLSVYFIIYFRQMSHINGIVFSVTPLSSLTRLTKYKELC